MVIPPEVILVVMLRHQSWADRDVSREERAAALAPVAELISEEAHSIEEVAEALEIGIDEGENFSLAIVRGGCTRSGCDHGLSRGLFQLRERTCPRAYLFPAGSIESLQAEVHCSISRLRENAYRCREHALTPLHGAYSMYATGHSCHWSGADARVRKTWRLVAELKMAEKREVTH